MADVKKILEAVVNGLKVNLFEFDIENEDGYNEIKEYLINKIRITKVHNMEEYDLTYYGAKNMNPAFVAKFNEQIAKINIPKRTSIPQFDVRRERITEWLAQYLLEQKYNCKFYDEADKRINMKTVEIDKHTDGIDVPGIWLDNNKIKFVVCEVKASEDKKIPCGSVKSLQEDIQKAVDDADNRVSREILEYMHGIRNVKIHDDLLQKIIDFLGRLIAGEKEDLIENIIFFPFLIRNNNIIVANRNINDYKNFSLQRVKKENVENIVASFGKELSDFSNEVYEQAIGE